ncbi:MAG: TRAP transporter small permease [Candidatus Rokubacteria bacterium]|nr:TRAP transporter small permease [Candidatus Rokubacteria bacterium]
MERVVLWVERVAGASLAAVALLVFVSVMLRDLFSLDLPDSFDFSRYLQGIAIFWGLAVATYRNAHITVDVVWELSGNAWRRAIDLVAAVVNLLFMGLFAYMLVERFTVVQRAHQLTSDLKLPIWPFYAILSAGIVATAAVGLIRVAELVRGTAADQRTG